MAILKMKRLRMLAVKSQREDILRELQLFGCVEVSEPDYEKDGIGGDIAALVRRETSEIAKLRSELLSLSNALRLLDKYVPVKSSFLAPKPEMKPGVLLDDAELEECLTVSKTMGDMDDQIRRITAEESRLRGVVESLMPWENLDIPVDFAGTRQTLAITGTVPSTIDLDNVEKAVYAVTSEMQFFRISSDREASYVLVICMKDDQPQVVEALRSFGFSPPSLGALAGTARENIRSSETRLSELAAEKDRLEKDIGSFSKHRDAVKRCTDRVSVKIMRVEAAEKLLYTDTAFALQGWLPVENEGGFSSAVAKFDCAWELEEPSGEQIERNDVPVKLKNNRITRCLNMVTEMYSLPAYGGVDPNPLMAPFFILFYGMMMADMGYGLLMAIAGLVVLKKAKPGKGMKNFFELMLYCGISTFIWGIATGGFFGDLIAQILKIMNPESTFVWFWTPLIDPMADTIVILIGSMALGFIHIITGMIVSFVRKVKAGQLMDGIWDEGTWWVIFAGIALMVLDIGNVAGVPALLALGGLMLLVGSGRNSKGIGKIGAIFDAFYSGVTGFFGDILSYSRLMALMLAGSVIASVFNTLGAIPGNLIFFFIISLFGNALNFALNLLGCYVHDLRLQCLEFFGKFYEDGGRPFKPLNLDTKFVNVIKNTK